MPETSVSLPALNRHYLEDLTLAVPEATDVTTIPSSETCDCILKVSGVKAEIEFTNFDMTFGRGQDLTFVGRFRIQANYAINYQWVRRIHAKITLGIVGFVHEISGETNEEEPQKPGKLRPAKKPPDPVTHKKRVTPYVFPMGSEEQEWSVDPPVCRVQSVIGSIAKAFMGSNLRILGPPLTAYEHYRAKSLEKEGREIVGTWATFSHSEIICVVTFDIASDVKECKDHHTFFIQYGFPAVRKKPWLARIMGGPDGMIKSEQYTPRDEGEVSPADGFP